MTSTPTTPAKSLSQQFLDDYIADPVKNPYGQFYTQAYLGSKEAYLPQLREKYGMVDPFALADEQLKKKQEYQKISDPYERVKTRIQDTQASKWAARDAKQAAYKEFKDAYGAAQNLFREQSAKGFASAEEEARARQGLEAVREATFGKYQAARGYLDLQNRLAQDAQRINRARPEYYMAEGNQALMDRFPTNRAAEEEEARRSIEFERRMRPGMVKDIRNAYDAVKNLGLDGNTGLPAGASTGRRSFGEILTGLYETPLSEARSARMDRRWERANQRAEERKQERRQERKEKRRKERKEKRRENRLAGRMGGVVSGAGSIVGQMMG